MANPAGVPERPKGAGCKPAGSAYEGSNPSPCTALLAQERNPRERISLALRPLKGRFAPKGPARERWR